MDSLPVVSPKRIAKSCFNRWIALSGLCGTDYFGTVENFEHFRTNGRLATASIEIMTHPSFDQQGTLIDHIDNLPLADRLTCAFRDLRLSGYSERAAYNTCHVVRPDESRLQTAK